jgi:hypothetical protein
MCPKGPEMVKVGEVSSRAGSDLSNFDAFLNI